MVTNEDKKKKFWHNQNSILNKKIWIEVPTDLHVNRDYLL